MESSTSAPIGVRLWPFLVQAKGSPRQDTDPYPSNPGAWTEERARVLASPRCAGCGGSGLRAIAGDIQACGCVLRRVFRACFWRYLECIERPRRFGPKNEDFISDFELVGLRALGDDKERAIFRLVFVSGVDDQTSAERVGLARNEFQAFVRRIQEKAGRAFREVKPYPLFPTGAYFQAPSRRATA